MFYSTRLKLTVWYLIIIMLISVSFSLIFYNRSTHAIDQTLQRHAVDVVSHHGLSSRIKILEESKAQIIWTLIFVNLGIFVVAGGLGYILAGKTLQPIEKMVEEQKRFIADASHELRTPLTGLITSTEVTLRNKKLTVKDATGALLSNLNEAKRLKALSDSLLTLARYQQIAKLAFERVFLSDVINEAIKRLKPIFEDKNIKIETRLQNVHLSANKPSLTELFIVLLDNAIKYSPRASTIRVHSESNARAVTVKIQDEGIGIDEYDAKHIFDRFYRGASSGEGFGLGLSIAKQIVDLHNGVIRVESRLGKGSVFIVTLPR